MSSTGKNLLVLVLDRTLLNPIAITISSLQQPLITLAKRETELSVNPGEMAKEHWFARPVNKALGSLGGSESLPAQHTVPRCLTFPKSTFTMSSTGPVSAPPRLCFQRTEHLVLSCRCLGFYLVPALPPLPPSPILSVFF